MGLAPFLFAGSSVYASEQSSGDLAQAIEEKYTPEIIEKDGVVTESFVVSSEDLATLESIYLANNISPRAWGSDIPKRTTKTSGSFKVSSVIAFSGAIAGVFGAGTFGPVAGIVADAVGLGGKVYYVYTHTTWRTKGVLYVQGKMDFYRDAGHKKYITSTHHNRQYSDNMLD